MLKKIILFLVLLPVFLFAKNIQAEAIHDKKITLDLQSVNIQDALHILAKFINMNVVISPEISGVITLHLKNSFAIETIDLLLASHHLTKSKIGNVWYIASREELLQRKQEELKLRVASDAVAPLVTRV